MSYWFVIYYVDEEQKQIVLDIIVDVNVFGLWFGIVVIEVELVGDFW